MPAYDRSFNPPAPVADVIVIHPVTGARSNILRRNVDARHGGSMSGLEWFMFGCATGVVLALLVFF